MRGYRSLRHSQGLSNFCISNSKGYLLEAEDCDCSLQIRDSLSTALPIHSRLNSVRKTGWLGTRSNRRKGTRMNYHSRGHARNASSEL